MSFQHSLQSIIQTVNFTFSGLSPVNLENLYRCGARFYIDSGAKMVGMSIGNPKDMAAHASAASYPSVGRWVSTGFELPLHPSHPKNKASLEHAYWAPPADEIRSSLLARAEGLAEILLTCAKVGAMAENYTQSATVVLTDPAMFDTQQKAA